MSALDLVRRTVLAGDGDGGAAGDDLMTGVISVFRMSRLLRLMRTPMAMYGRMEEKVLARLASLDTRSSRCRTRLVLAASISALMARSSLEKQGNMPSSSL